jgi:putative transposase
MANRLKRLDWVFDRFPLYFVTASTARRRSLLANPNLHKAFIRFASAADSGAWVGRYVLMPNHVHFFVAIDDERLGLSVWMKSLKGSLSSVLRSSGCPSPYWQKGFFDHVLRSGESYSEKWNYVRDNPVRAGLVISANDWPYSGEINRLEY